MNRQFATFRLGNTLYGIDVLLVDEVNRQLDIVPVAGAPEFVRGLLNLRGQIVTALDVGAKIGEGEWAPQASARCIVLKTSRMLSHLWQSGAIDDDTCAADMVGLLVSRVENIVAAGSNDIEPAPANVDETTRRYIAGVVQLDNELLSILKVGELLALEDAPMMTAS